MSLFKCHRKVDENYMKGGGKVRQTKPKEIERNERPAMSEEAREKQLIALAMDRAEQQLRDGTASSQLITEFIKRGANRYKLENEKLQEENKLLRARTENLQAVKNIEEKYTKAIAAMRSYSGHEDDDYED